MRVGVFTSDSAAGVFTLRAVLGKTANLDTEFGTVQVNGVVSELCSTPVKTTADYQMSNLAHNGKIYFKVVAWLDGVVLNDQTAGNSAIVGLKFQASNGSN